MFTLSLVRAAQKELAKLPHGLYAAMIDLMEELGEAGNNLKEPKVRDVGNGLKELRVNAQEGIARGFFFFEIDRRIYVVHILHKKSPKTPKSALELAKNRMRDLKRGLQDGR
ncbi:type II toxin-antitoxin system RelE/ParE family toxin [Sodalis sp. RH21]|uniref:type II toxin-antitoxin system RelE/ParE family toxin n=1 Tax=unclassified Sodalis (in: enterobacteria) TaxID=2636512 RepID=UPI0039B3B739